MENVSKLTPPQKPKLRNFKDYIADMTAYAKEDSNKIFKDTEFYPIRFLYEYAKKRKANLFELRPIKADRKKICNRIMKKTIYDAEISYSKCISSGEYDT